MSHIYPLPKLEEPARARGKNELATRWLEAARGGLLEQLAALLEVDGTLVDSGDAFGTALHWAAVRDHAHALPWLLGAGVRIEARSAAGCTALHVAAHRGHSDSAACLLKEGAEVSAFSKALMTPLHHVVVSGNSRLARMLLDAGASMAPYDPRQPKAGRVPRPYDPLCFAARVSASASGVKRQGKRRNMLQLLEREQKALNSWFRDAEVVACHKLHALLLAGARNRIESTFPP